MQIIKELQTRGSIQDISTLELDQKLKIGDKFYAGFDPTAPSLHLGNFVVIMAMLRLTKAGLKPMMLFGGATGQVGDPSGKAEERPILDLNEVSDNVNAQKNQVSQIFSRLGFEVEFVDNAEWTTPISFTTFLREVGKYLTVNYMLAKESVKRRVEGDGMSFAEFSYMLIQANDFLHLYQNKGVVMQIGGSDQWGNLTCGMELVRKKLHQEVYTFSIPLLTDSNGKKFGKSEKGALWLDSEKTSPFVLHQFLLNSADADVINLIQKLTFADPEQIASLSQSLMSEPEKRIAQTYLADEVCSLIHGKESVESAKIAAKVLFGGDPTGLPVKQLLEIFSEVPSFSIPKNDLLETKFLDLLVKVQACASKGQSRKLIESGGAYLNNLRIADIDSSITANNLIEEQLLILRTGKKSYFLVKAEA